MTDPASIRYNNPGAMWGKGNPIAKRWGNKGTVGLNDGLGQGNNIAFFPTKVDGASAQFDLWRTSYCNRTLQSAVTRWSGGNSSPQYMSFLESKTGLSADSMITPMLLEGPTGLKLMKAQAQWEAGRPYPLTDDEWKIAQEACFSKGKVMSSGQKKVVALTSTAITTTAAASHASSTGNEFMTFLFIILGVMSAIGLYIYFHQKGEPEAIPASAIPTTPTTPPIDTKPDGSN